VGRRDEKDLGYGKCVVSFLMSFDFQNR
jgi:hypothetical protein